VLHSWRDDAATTRWERWAEGATGQLQANSLKRTVFHAWKRGTVFLPWDEEWMKVAAHLAVRHYKRRLLGAWRRVAQSGARRLAIASEGVGQLLLRDGWGRWRAAKAAVHLFAIAAKRRGMAWLARLVQERIRRAGLEDGARIAHRYYMQQAAVNSLRRAVARRIRRKVLDNAADDLFVRQEYHRRQTRLQTSFFLWGIFAAVRVRFARSAALAVRHRRVFPLRRAWAKWLRRLTGSARSHRGRTASGLASLRLKRRAVGIWRLRALPATIIHSLLPVSPRTEQPCDADAAAAERRTGVPVQDRSPVCAPGTGFRSKRMLLSLAARAAAHLHNRLLFVHAADCFAFWRSLTRAHRKTRGAAKCVAGAARSGRLTTSLRAWRGLWVKRLCWRAKAAVIDQSELFAQISLLQSESGALKAEQDDMKAFEADLVAALDRMR
jgi:hypothetical protein